MRPTRRHRAGHPQAPPYLALLRPGFAVPGNLTAPAVGSYPTVSPLPAPENSGRWRSVLCGTFQGSPPLGFPRAACPAESGPSSGEQSPAAPCPSPPPRHPRITAPRALQNYTPRRAAAMQKMKTIWTEPAPEEDEEGAKENSPHHVRPNPGAPRIRCRMPSAFGQGEDPLGQLQHRMSRRGTVGFPFCPLKEL